MGILKDCSFEDACKIADIIGEIALKQRARSIHEPYYQCPLCSVRAWSGELMDHIAEKHPEAKSPLPIYPVPVPHVD
jgi:hypothetical protein